MDADDDATFTYRHIDPDIEQTNGPLRWISPYVAIGAHQVDIEVPAFVGRWRQPQRAGAPPVLNSTVDHNAPWSRTSDVGTGLDAATVEQIVERTGSSTIKKDQDPELRSESSRSPPNGKTEATKDATKATEDSRLTQRSALTTNVPDVSMPHICSTLCTADPNDEPRQLVGLVPGDAPDENVGESPLGAFETSLTPPVVS